MNNTSEMTLSEVLNELDLTQDQALDYLSDRGYEIDSSLNTLVGKEIYNVLSHHFGKKDNLHESFKNSINKVVAVKNFKKDYSIGFVRPIRFYENEYKTRGLNKEERESLFINTGHLIIKRDFYLVDEKFENTEFFTLTYEEDSMFIPASKPSVKYCSNNHDASSCKKLPLMVLGKIYDILESEVLELPYSHHSFVFIKDDGKVYGPISIQQTVDHEEDNYEIQESYKYSIQPLPIKYFNLDQNYENVILRYNEEDIYDYLVINNYGKNGNTEYYISNIQHLVSNIEYESFELNEKDEDIIDLVNRQIPEEYKGNKENWVSSFAADNEITRTRFKKYLALKSKSENWLKFIEDYISSHYLNTDDGKKEIENYISKHENKIIGEKKDLYEERIIKQLEEESDQLQKAREEKKQLVDDINILKNEREAIKSKSEELRKIEENLTKAAEKLGLIGNIEELEDKIAELEEQKDKQYELYADVQNRVKKYQEMLTELQEQYSKESETSMRKKLIELQPYVSALNGASIQSSNQKIKEFSIIPFHESKNASIKTILYDFDEFLQKNNRLVKPEDALNYLTNIQQNFLTIFSGLPGVGKTSLATLISHYFTASKTFTTIPVSRGWNSRKNLLGYHNPISETYQHDEYGFLDLLKWYNTGESKNDIPAMILLDEANLSPMEHYWSDFISISDTDSQDKEIFIGENKLSIPTGMRFICTINNDHTTEVLSPRLIDRAAIIKIPYLKPSEDGSDLFNGAQNFLPEKIYSQEFLNEIFNSSSPELNRNEQKIFQEIISILHDDKNDFGAPIYVSHRKIKLIYNYCYTTRDLYFDITANQLLNIDFSILQHILPLINGQGSKYENRLIVLKDFLEEKGLFRSQKELNSIITKGQDYKNFSFF